MNTHGAFVQFSGAYTGGGPVDYTPCKLVGLSRLDFLPLAPKRLTLYLFIL